MIFICASIFTICRSGSRLFDLITSADERFLKAFYFAVNETLVADNEDQAMKFAFSDPSNRKRVVTLDGVIIETSGAMSGGGKPARGRMRLIKEGN